MVRGRRAGFSRVEVCTATLTTTDTAGGMIDYYPPPYACTEADTVVVLCVSQSVSQSVTP